MIKKWMSMWGGEYGGDGGRHPRALTGIDSGEDGDDPDWSPAVKHHGACAGPAGRAGSGGGRRGASYWRGRSGAWLSEPSGADGGAVHRAPGAWAAVPHG